MKFNDVSIFMDFLEKNLNPNVKIHCGITFAITDYIETFPYNVLTYGDSYNFTKTNNVDFSMTSRIIKDNSKILSEDITPENMIPQDITSKDINPEPINPNIINLCKTINSDLDKIVERTNNKITQVYRDSN